MSALPAETCYRARYLLAPDGVRCDAALTVSADGRILRLGPPTADAIDLGDVALVPGLVDAHSHAFQRALRGRTQHLDARHPTADFWTWRQAMYRVAAQLDPEAVETLARMTFLELALAGVTTVGEFHYLHHAPDGRAYADPNELAHRILAAARAIGLRITLLRVIYQRAGHGKPADPLQRRFIDGDVERALERTEALAQRWAGEPTIRVGLAPHSVRAVPAEAIAVAAAHARRQGWVLHLHACEQPAEIAECEAEHGQAPVALLERLGALGPQTTLIHGTWLAAGDLTRLTASDTLICACPTTERDLGDGFLPADALLGAGVRLCRGSDSHVRSDPWEDLRLIEYHERLQRTRRNVLAAHHPRWGGRPGGDLETAAVLWPIAAAHGAASLGQPGGALAPGAPTDFVTLDLAAPCLAGASPASLLADLVFSADARAVRGVYVGGRPIVQAGRHPAQAATVAAWRALAARLDLGAANL